MNKTRRYQLRRLAALACELRNQLADLVEEERAALDNTPDSLQSTDRYIEDDERCSELEEHLGNIEELENLLDSLEA